MSQAMKELWPGWKTGEVIGKGSFGAVYEIEKDGEKAALKWIPIPKSEGEIESLYNEGMSREEVSETFSKELQGILAEHGFMKALGDCPYVVHSDDVRYEQREDCIGWDVYIKMELLTPLTKIVTDEMPQEQVLQIGADLCKALELCKESGILHRDIKPQNIFVSDEGQYKLGDFGIAKVIENTTGGTKIGTYKYMAPEVYNNQPYGAGSDIYSLGLVLYWLLNERRMPFVPLPPAVPSYGDEENAKVLRFSGAPLPAPLHGSEDLKQVVLKACAFDPKERYLSAAQMRADLEAVMNGEPIFLAVAEGEAQAAVGQQKVVHRKFCKNCGKPVFPNVKFCKNCGAAVEDAQEEKPAPAKKNNKLLIIGLSAAIFLIAIAIVVMIFAVPRHRYNNAVELMESGQYAKAIDAFAALEGYEDSNAKITECEYYIAADLLAAGKYPEAQAAFEALGDYQDSAQKVTECQYSQAVLWMNQGKYADALGIFETLNGYGESDENILICKYRQAVALIDSGDLEGAIAPLEELGDYKDCPDRLKECKYACALKWKSEKKIVEAYETFLELPNYKDSNLHMEELKSAYHCIIRKPDLFVSGNWREMDGGGFTMKTTVLDENSMQIEINGWDFDDRYGTWIFTGYWDPTTGYLNYTNGKLYYDSVCEISNGVGWVWAFDGGVQWVDTLNTMGLHYEFVLVS